MKRNIDEIFGLIRDSRKERTRISDDDLFAFMDKTISRNVMAGQLRRRRMLLGAAAASIALLATAAGYIFFAGDKDDRNANNGESVPSYASVIHRTTPNDNRAATQRAVVQSSSLVSQPSAESILAKRAGSHRIKNKTKGEKSKIQTNLAEMLQEERIVFSLGGADMEQNIAAAIGYENDGTTGAYFATAVTDVVHDIRSGSQDFPNFESYIEMEDISMADGIGGMSEVLSETGEELAIFEDFPWEMIFGE